MQHAELVTALRRVFDADAVLDQPEARQPYSSDWITVDPRLPDLVVLPDTTQQVATALQLASAAGMPVVARGAGTGLAGGARPRHGGMVISSMRMQQIEQVDVPNRRAVVQPGVINYELSAYLQQQGYFYAPDPASWKMCSIGGNIANNSGGPRCLKYGVTTNHVLALEVVLHDGTVLWTGDGILEAAGYDLTGLLVGSEGTFGVVTRALLRLTRTPEANRVLLALFPNVVAACATVSAVLAAGLLPTALEVMDAMTMLAVNRAGGYHLPEEAGAALIIEIDGVEDGLDAMLDEIIAICHRHDALSLQAATSADEQEQLWSARRSAFASFHTLAPAYYLVDTVVPRTRLPAMMAHVQRLSREYAMPIANVFHAGDGNLHPLVLYDPANPEHVKKAHAITAEVLALSIAEGGTVSGEHGIGVEKQDFLARIFSTAELQAQAAVYAIFNPHDQLNPGKIFPRNVKPLELAQQHRARLIATRGTPTAADGPGAADATLSRLREELTQLLGAAYVLHGAASTPYTIQDRYPDLVALPADLEQLSAVMAACHRAGAQVLPWGGGTQQTPDRQPATGDRAQPEAGLPPTVILSTQRLNSVLHYEPDDLTIGVGAGMTLHELQTLLAAHGQMLPLDAPLPERATLGGLVATATDGPRRLGYGLLRDMLLGLTVVEADGSVLRLGGQVVKNVSGYDMVKLFLGSHGSLGVIAEVRLRSFPRPQAEATLLATFPTRAQVLALLDDLATTQLLPTAVEYLERGALDQLGLTLSGGYGLALRVEGAAAACERHMRDLRALARQHAALALCAMDGENVGELWAHIVDLSAATTAPGTALLRLAVPPTDFAAALAHLEHAASRHGVEADVSGRALNGIIYARLRGEATHIAQLQQALIARWKHSHLLTGALPAGAEHLRWGAPPHADALSLMQQIKAAFDPFATLNPGRFSV